MKTASLPMEGLRWANVAITDIVVETTNHEQNLREPHSEFLNLDDVHAFYNIYAKEAGFSVRLGSSKKSKDTNVIERRIFVLQRKSVMYFGEE
ncbi:hypothetical protein ACOSQ3_026947 [Xanthoceras sorbifolium]